MIKDKLLPVGSKVICTAKYPEGILIIYGYTESFTQALAKLPDWRKGHNGNGVDLYDEEGNRISPPPVSTGYWFVVTSDLTLYNPNKIKLKVKIPKI